MRIPKKEPKELVQFAIQVAKDCQLSQHERAASYRQYGAIAETGRQSGGLAQANLIYSHLDRLASHLFSPNELRFTIDYENIYPKQEWAKGQVAARIVSREWERQDVDVLFGHGVFVALTYGAAILKQKTGRDKAGNPIYRGADLVMPWQFAVYNEGKNDLSEQEAFVETCWLNKHEVWRRVRGLPDAEKLYKNIIGNAAKEEGTGTPTSFMHQVLSTAVLQTGIQSGQPQPGGIVQLTSDPTYASLSPTVAADLYPMQELWVWDDERDDYTTIQFFEPDVLVAPRLKHMNLLADDVHPYTLIQPNKQAGYFWGRSEIVDLMMLQQWLSTHLDDIKRIVGLSIDKIMAIKGYPGLTDELFGQITRVPGVYAVEQGVEIQDLSPKLTQELIELIPQIIGLMERVSGFQGVMSGQGEQGVRSDVHAERLMKTGSPRLRDRSLLVERQAAQAGDVTLSILEAKDATAVWTDPEKGETDFVLSQLMDDRRIAVDSHSSSPIYHDDQTQLLAFGLKSGIITGESFIELSALPHKETLIARLKEKEKNELMIITQHPEILADKSKKERKALVGQAAQGDESEIRH